MPLYEIKSASELVPFRQLVGGPELYEKEIEDLLWENLEAIIGEAMFRVARQPTIDTGGRPDIVALDRDARVVVIEVKRDIDRNQLAQCLEYAGWARESRLDDLAQLYSAGQSQFFEDWEQFTNQATPPPINRSPRLILVAHGFDGRSESALEYLQENGLPVDLVEITLYRDENGRRFLDVTAEREPKVMLPMTAIAVGPDRGAQTPTGATRDARIHPKIAGRRVRLTDLLDGGLLKGGDRVIWERPRVGKLHRAVLRDNGVLELEDGSLHSSPSSAAIAAAGRGAYDGWECWKVDALNGQYLADLRRELLHRVEGS